MSQIDQTIAWCSWFFHSFIYLQQHNQCPITLTCISHNCIPIQYIAHSNLKQHGTNYTAVLAYNHNGIMTVLYMY